MRHVVILLTLVGVSQGPEHCHPPSNKQWTCTGQDFIAVPQTEYLVEFLDLSENNLTHITEDSFQTHDMLIDLRLSHNSLFKIDVGAFKKLAALTYLDLSANKLTYIHPCTFYLNLNLEDLLLSHNPLHLLDAGTTVLASRSLQVLDLRFTGLSGFSVDNFADLPSLSYLYLSYNTSEQQLIRDMTSLFTLQLINRHHSHHCDLKVTWRAGASSIKTECWKQCASREQKQVHVCTEHRDSSENIITTTADNYVDSSSRSEHLNDLGVSTTAMDEVVMILLVTMFLLVQSYLII